MTIIPTKDCRIAYVVSKFPVLSETFVFYEILEMERLGISVEVYPLRCRPGRFEHPETNRLISKTHYTLYLSPKTIFVNLYFIVRRPIAYAKVLTEVLLGNLGSRKFFLVTCCIFAKAVRYAYTMRAHGATHIHAQFANHSATAALIAHRLVGIPFSFTARGSDIHVDRRMLKQKVEAAQFALTVSNYNKDLMVDECGIDSAEKIHVIYGGVDTEAFSPVAVDEANRPLQILCVGRFEEVKGHCYLVDACRCLRERGVEFECHLVGDGELRPAIERQISNAGLGAMVQLHGACSHSEVVKQMSLADVVVLPTVPSASGKLEGIPNVLKEAMSCGLPVVGSLIAAIPELVEHERSGLLVRPGEPTEIADSLQRLSADSRLRREMGRIGRERILRDFNVRTSSKSRAELFLGKTQCQPAVWDKQMQMNDLSILACPVTNSPLQLSGDQLTKQFNRAVANGTVRNIAHQGVDQKVDALLVRSDELVVYPVRDGIPILLSEEAIPLNQFAITKHKMS